jgi:hypothetical protein
MPEHWYPSRRVAYSERKTTTWPVSLRSGWRGDEPAIWNVDPVLVDADARA